MAFQGLTLKEAVIRYREQKGITKLMYRGSLRDLLYALPLNEAINQIATFTDYRDLDALISIGLRGALWDTVIAQRARLEGLI